MTTLADTAAPITLSPIEALSTGTPAPRGTRPAGGPARPIRPTRGDILDTLGELLVDLAASGRRTAWQGASDAPEVWRRSTGAADLDIWCDDDAADVLADALTGFSAAAIQRADRPGRLRHTSYAIETLDGLAVVDLTRGDLMVGPVLLVPAREVTVTAEARLSGVSAAADLVVRPLLRGRLVTGDRLDEARSAWAAATPAEREAFLQRMRSELTDRVSDGISAVLAGHDAPTDLIRAARRAVVRRSLAPRSLAATWSHRHTVVPAGRRAGVLGLRTTGCLVVLVGTDGSGKSTVSAEIDDRLTRAGLRTSTAYLGMARGNLPGVGMARRLLGVAPAGDSAPKAKAATTAPSAPAALDQAMVRRAAAWYYAAEYGYRWWRDIRPGMRNGGVVISDRYVYDLRESPWPGSAASRFAEWLMPRPDVLVLPDAPDRVIHARKPERTAGEQAAQQDRFRALVADNPARTASLTVDTSGMSPADLDPVAAVVSAVVSSLHRLH